MSFKTPNNSLLYLLDKTVADLHFEQQLYLLYIYQGSRREQGGCNADALLFTYPHPVNLRL